MRCSASGSNRSASFVDSTRSQKRIVTIFRVSRSAGAARGAPQAAQKRASSPLAAPQREQVAIGQVYGGKRSVWREALNEVIDQEERDEEQREHDPDRERDPGDRDRGPAKPAAAS